MRYRPSCLYPLQSTVTITTAIARLCHYGKAEAAQLVANDLGRATPMYALLLPSKGVDQDIKRLPLIQGYNSKQSEKSNTRPGIMTLTNDVVAFTLDSVFSLRAK